MYSVESQPTFRKNVSNQASKPAFSLVSCLAYSTIKMGAICSSKRSVEFQRTTRRYIAEVSALHNYHCENLKPYIITFFLMIDEYHTSIIY
jgi:hypothetical protein